MVPDIALWLMIKLVITNVVILGKVFIDTGRVRFFFFIYRLLTFSSDFVCVEYCTIGLLKRSLDTIKPFQTVSGTLHVSLSLWAILGAATNILRRSI